MSMKKSDLDKGAAMKIDGKMRGTAVPGRFAQQSTLAHDKREQRRRDSAAGLVAFACKLPADLVQRLQERGAAHAGGLNGLMAELVSKGLQ